MGIENTPAQNSQGPLSVKEMQLKILLLEAQVEVLIDNSNFFGENAAGFARKVDQIYDEKVRQLNRS